MVYAEFLGTTVGKPPKSYSAGRPYGGLIWIVIHTTEGGEGPDAAENGNAYDARRTDGTSTHVFTDSNSVVQEVNSGDRAHAALAVANNRGYQVEICGTAAQTAAQWKDAASLAELERTAQHCAHVAQKYGIPAKWCTKADVDARRPGFLTHAMVTAWLDGTHTDPGANFPFAWFVGRVAYWRAEYYPPPKPPVPPAPVERKPTMLVQKTGDPQVWCVVPGVGRYWVTKDTIASHLAVYGTIATGPGVDPADFGPVISAPGVESTPARGPFSAASDFRTAVAGLDDSQVDHTDVNVEHDPNVIFRSE